MESNTVTITSSTPSEQDRHREYLICKERGHGSTAVVLTSNPPWNVCSKCGVHWRNETTLLEDNVPVKPMAIDHDEQKSK